MRSILKSVVTPAMKSITAVPALALLVTLSLSPPAGHAGERGRSDTVSEAPVNVNSASLAVLVTLKGVGEKKARAIIAYRKSHGPFHSLDEFEEVPGIGPALIENNQGRIVFK